MTQLNIIRTALVISLALSAWAMSWAMYNNDILIDANDGSIKSNYELINSLNRSSDALRKTNRSLKGCTDIITSLAAEAREKLEKIEMRTEGGNSPNIFGSGPLALELGSASVPRYSFYGDTDLPFYKVEGGLIDDSFSVTPGTQSQLDELSTQSEACYVGRNEEGKSVYHVRGFGFAVIIAKSLGWTKSPKGSVTEVQDEPLDWSKYGNCAN